TKPVRSNEDALRSILQNLIHNAILYRKKGERATVQISVSEAPTQIIIRVKDNGIGIPEKIQGRVFEMFFRGSNESEGSGLGLYLVKNAVTKLNGSVTMKSAEGAGTEFIVTLPAG
ncbi:MAG TPA: HAMP domain-containing sensor histidine kinase, partial [Chitinophagales bacterium]|nr:HAMP domain-containing sensor histidine kinase [Chitinophagales bacterium]